MRKKETQEHLGDWIGTSSFSIFIIANESLQIFLICCMFEKLFCKKIRQIMLDIIKEVIKI